MDFRRGRPQVQPSVVLLELCHERQALAMPEPWPPEPLAPLADAVRALDGNVCSPLFWCAQQCSPSTGPRIEFSLAGGGGQAGVSDGSP